MEDSITAPLPMATITITAAANHMPSMVNNDRILFLAMLAATRQRRLSHQPPCLHRWAAIERFFIASPDIALPGSATRSRSSFLRVVCPLLLCGFRR
jgi:hypothetical protein